MKRDAGRTIVICAALAAAALAVFWPVLHHDFINYDDDVYVTENPEVRAGLTLDGLRWAWTTSHAANWHPLTWISHMLDCELFGLDPRGHHLTSLIAHVLNSQLLFLLLRRMTGAVWRSALVAVLFAVHPLHVESVAWVAERKDVLSTLFGLLTLLAYARYAERPRPARFAWVSLLLALGLTAKPMLVTLPFLLLLLDHWPLGRSRNESWRRLVVEKLPLFGLAALSGVVTIAVQRAGGALGSMELYPLGARISNAVVSCAGYLRKMVWPADLAVFYPHPGSEWVPWRVAAAAAVILAVSVLAVRMRRRHPALLTGWLWYLVTLAPVIGFIQVGQQAMADRYTYLPLIGVFAGIVWIVPDLRSRRVLAATAGVAAGVTIVALIAAARAQVGHWRDSVTLFRHALEVTENNHIAHNSLGVELRRLGRETEAMEHYREALRVRPGDADAHYNLGLSLAEQGRTDEALEHFRSAARARPGFAKAHYNCGTLLAERGQWERAVAHLRRVVALDPGYAEAHYNLGAALYFQGRYAEAWRQMRLAETHGYAPPQSMLDLLREAMPEPELP